MRVMTAFHSPRIAVTEGVIKGEDVCEGGFRGGLLKGAGC